jgi:hypothetical protein
MTSAGGGEEWQNGRHGGDENSRPVLRVAVVKTVAAGGIVRMYRRFFHWC